MLRKDTVLKLHCNNTEPLPDTCMKVTRVVSVAEDAQQARTIIDTASLLNENRKQTRSGDAFTPLDPAGRIPTREVWKFISSLEDVIRHQTATMEATQNELQEVKLGQHLLQE